MEENNIEEILPPNFPFKKMPSTPEGSVTKMINVPHGRVPSFEDFQNYHPEQKPYSIRHTEGSKFVFLGDGLFNDQSP